MTLSNKRARIIENNIHKIESLYSKKGFIIYKDEPILEIRCQLFNSFYLFFKTKDSEINLTEYLNSLTKNELQYFFNNLLIQPNIIPLYKYKY